MLVEYEPVGSIASCIPVLMTPNPDPCGRGAWPTLPNIASSTVRTCTPHVDMSPDGIDRENRRPPFPAQSESWVFRCGIRQPAFPPSSRLVLVAGRPNHFLSHISPAWIGRRGIALVHKRVQYFDHGQILRVHRTPRVKVVIFECAWVLEYLDVFTSALTQSPRMFGPLLSSSPCVPSSNPPETAALDCRHPSCYS